MNWRDTTHFEDDNRILKMTTAQVVEATVRTTFTRTINNNNWKLLFTHIEPKYSYPAN